MDDEKYTIAAIGASLDQIRAKRRDVMAKFQDYELLALCLRLKDWKKLRRAPDAVLQLVAQLSTEMIFDHIQRMLEEEDDG